MLAAGLLLVVLLLALGAWLLGSAWGRKRIEQEVRSHLTKDSELVLAPFEVDISPWRDFPHLTASLHHFSLTDTTGGQPLPVLRFARADLRLDLAHLLRRQLRVTRLSFYDGVFQERTDPQGRRWGLRGRRARGPARPPDPRLGLDSVLLDNCRVQTRNEYTRNAVNAHLQLGRLRARLRGGVLQLDGQLSGRLDSLRTRTGVLFRNEDVQARVNYRYLFGQRRGLIWNTAATLNGDTIRVSGTHTAALDRPVGTVVHLRFEGQQPLLAVLEAALPPSLRPFLEGARSRSKAHIRYTISGLSAPTIRPHNVLQFGLDGASIAWVDRSRRISRWDLRGTYDNGPEHRPRSASLTLERCRLYSSAGQLDIALRLHNFLQPVLDAHLLGRTELPELAAVVAPGLWQARHGVADVDVRLRGPLPAAGQRATLMKAQQNLSVRGTVTLQNASFLLLHRNASVSDLNVRIGLRDSLWQLSNAAGQLDRMRFRASATTLHLFDYLTDQHPTTEIAGDFSVDELNVADLRQLLRPLPKGQRSPGAGKRRKRARPAPGELAASLASSLIPPGLHLRASLRCQRLVLAADTLSNLAVTVRHDGQQVQLLDLAGDVWGGRVQGRLDWPTDTSNRVAPVNYQLGIRFGTINYRQLLARLLRPPRRSSKAPKSPALSELILAANGKMSWDIAAVELPDGQHLRNLAMRLNKTGSTMRMPFLRFEAPQGGTGSASGSARVANMRIAAADANVSLRYPTLDVQDLLRMIGSLTEKPDSVPAARTAARAERKARRIEENSSGLLSNGVLTALLRVQADQVRYADIQGSDFRLVTHLRDGEARVDDCSLEAFQGRISLRGRLLTTEGRDKHPLHVQALFQDIQLADLFTTARAMGLNVLTGDNVRGTLRCAADLHTDLDAAFLPAMNHTFGYLRTDISGLELIEVEALEQSLKFMKAERTSHLYFEPVSSSFILTQGQLLIPRLRLNSNLSNLEISGTYVLDGRANLFVGLSPLQALFGNNDKRVERIQNGELLARPKSKLTYVSLSRPYPGVKYKVRLFQKDEHREQQAALRLQYRQLLSQRLDTTLHLLR
ncbi:hypothetical protein GCM10023185_31110 [Hymenobacter saemangeumensis]|uniref:AsmA-like C-terminal domain-containing protein n=2 Tax=Hymenobacter saemangeumensis TaxID=1084522 RepID=A0ABP8ILY6_9BACT